jgi:ubiquinone/menaquinone biosynthesis C-methylase UbiE
MRHQIEQLKTGPFVEETSFGNWFISSNTWKIRVLRIALNDLERLFPEGVSKQRDIILDVGCGFGISFNELVRRFQPSKIVALDADPNLFSRAGKAAKACSVPVELVDGNAARMPFDDNSFDLVYCHQAFHHIVEQEAAMTEFYRVLKPGGVLLFAESTKRYIHSYLIRYLFSHPMATQKTASEYLDVIRSVGFSVTDSQISYPFLWWSREDLGLLEKLGFKPKQEREETLVNLVAIKHEIAYF